MNGLKNVTNVMIIIAACAIGGIIFSGMLLLPKFNELQVINKKIKVMNDELTYKKEYFLKLKDIETKIKEYQPELAKIDIALPNYPDLPSFFDYLQTNTSQSGLVINSMGGFAVSPSSKYPGLKEISLSLSVSGPYESLKNFFSILEKSSRMIDVETVSFSGSKDNKEANNKQENIFVFNLAIKVYSY